MAPSTYYDTKTRAPSARALIALIESPQVCSLKFLTCEQGSV